VSLPRKLHQSPSPAGCEDQRPSRSHATPAMRACPAPRDVSCPRWCGDTVVIEKSELRTHAIHMGKREVRRIRTTALRLSGHDAAGPRGVDAQSKASTSRVISCGAGCSRRGVLKDMGRPISCCIVLISKDRERQVPPRNPHTDRERLTSTVPRLDQSGSG